MRQGLASALSYLAAYPKIVFLLGGKIWGPFSQETKKNGDFIAF